jgi:phenylpyruvate tautomerase PptA (4-oxalocrotonate tautomerase family)
VPRYELTTDDELTGPQKAALAADITAIHTAVTGAPARLVHVVYHVLGPGNAFVGGEAQGGTYLQGSIRSGRSVETTTELLNRLSTTVSRHTGAPRGEVVVTLREGPGHLVNEGGHLVPDPGHEAPTS